MAGASTTILERMIGQTLSEAGFQKVPADFNFKNTPTNFKRKVFKKTLEEIITIFEVNKDLRQLPPVSILAIKDGLIDISEGFIELLESRITQNVKKELDAVYPLLGEALAFMYTAMDELEENKGKKTYNYYDFLQKCRKKMSEIKLQLRAWKIPEGTK